MEGMETQVAALIINAATFYALGSRSNLTIGIDRANRIFVEIEDTTSGRNTRTARIHLGDAKLWGIATVLSVAGSDLDELRQRMAMVFAEGKANCLSQSVVEEPDASSH